MKDTVALERLAALHAGSGDAATFCQLCLRGEGDDGVRVASLGRLCAARAHLTCADCVSSIADAARPSASAASPAWGAIAGCPACALPDTDAGMTRLFRRGRDASLPPGAPVVEAPVGPVAADRSSSALMTRDSLSRADVEALAGVLVAERARRLREDDDASSSSSSSAADDETDADPSGPTSWWPRRDVAAQLRSALGALPSLNALRTAAPGIFADLAVVSNGSALLGSGAGVEIDAHSCVARFNEYEIGGAFAEDVGERVDVHATGWLMAAARDDPRDRLAAEEEEEEEEGEEEGEEETIGTRSETIDARLDVRVDEPGGSRSRSRVRPRVEIRLMPNDPALGRAYFVSYLRAIAYHRRRWNNHRREKKKPPPPNERRTPLSPTRTRGGSRGRGGRVRSSSRRRPRRTGDTGRTSSRPARRAQPQGSRAGTSSSSSRSTSRGKTSRRRRRLLRRRATTTALKPLPLRPAPGPSARARLGVLPAPPRGSLCTGSRTTLGTRRTPRGGTTSTGCTSSATTCTTSRGSAPSSPRSSPGGPTPSPERCTSPLMRGSESVDDEGRSVV